jgi:hypothetical protein
MKDKLNSLSKENLVEILFRVYHVHQKDVEYYEAREDKLLKAVHETRVARIEHYVESALNKEKEK